ncbi:MAG: hypothetical protein ACRDI2_06015 [Chloroflexota bacterium]
MIDSTKIAGRPPGGHLDELTAMLIADGEPVAAPLADHATTCAICAALVAAFRVEGSALASTFALDDDELGRLRQAGVPGQVAAVTGGRAQYLFQPLQQDTPASLLAMLIVAIAGYVGWLFAPPVLLAGFELARRSGAATIAAQVVTGWVLTMLWSLWNVFRAVEQLRVLDAPALPMLALAVLTWVAIWLMPQRLAGPQTAPVAEGM